MARIPETQRSPVMSRQKLRTQVFTYLTTTLLFIGVLFSFALLFLEAQRNKLMIRKVDMYIHAIVTHRKEILANEIYLNHKKAINLIAKKIAVDPEIINISIFLPDGHAYFHLNPAQDSGTGDNLSYDILNPLTATNNPIILNKKTDDHSLRVFTYPLIVIDEVQGFLQIAYNMDDIIEANRLNVALFIILVLSILSILMITLSRILSRYVIKPLELLSSTMLRIGQGRLGEQVHIDMANEMGDMAKTFNLMSRENKRMVETLHTSNVQLNQLQNLLSDIINSMPFVLIGVDSRIRITHWNRRAEEIIRISSSDAKGNRLSDVYPGMKPWIKRIKESIKKGRLIIERKCPHSLSDKNGYEDITIYPLETNGIEGVVIIIEDVTEKARMEEMMIQNEKMLSVGGLAAGMAHEINNPLAGVIQNAGVLENRLTDKTMPANIKTAESLELSMEKIHDFMTARDIPQIIMAIKESGSRMASIVDNMLNFARKSDSSFSSHDPVNLLEKVLLMASTDYDLKKKFDFKSIAIEKKYEESLPLIACNGNEIQQVLLNILNNGAHAMHEKASREKKYTPLFILRILKETEPNMLRIEIADNGPGMDEETQSKVFEPFFTTKPVGVGTGLGLSVSYFIITENHKGTIDVVSEVGKGTKFMVRLPLNV
jgi:PAS domain S-box-containing protein